MENKKEIETSLQLWYEAFMKAGTKMFNKIMKDADPNWIPVKPYIKKLVFVERKSPFLVILSTLIEIYWLFRVLIEKCIDDYKWNSKDKVLAAWYIDLKEFFSAWHPLIYVRVWCQVKYMLDIIRLLLIREATVFLRILRFLLYS